MTCKKAITVAAALLALMTVSCMRRPMTYTIESGHFYIDPAANVKTIGKVVILEFENRSTNPDICAGVTEAVGEALQKKHIFAVRTMHPSDDKWLALGLENVASFDADRLAQLEEQLDADAVIFGSVTQYYPYPHLLMGMNLKMIDLRKGKLLWAMEQVWDSSDKSLELRMKRYSKDCMREGYQPLDWQLFITSPLAFNKFIAAEIAQTFWGTGQHRVSAKILRERNRQR